VGVAEATPVPTLVAVANRRAKAPVPTRSLRIIATALLGAANADSVRYSESVDHWDSTARNFRTDGTKNLAAIRRDDWITQSNVSIRQRPARAQADPVPRPALMRTITRMSPGCIPHRWGVVGAAGVAPDPSSPRPELRTRHRKGNARGPRVSRPLSVTASPQQVPLPGGEPPSGSFVSSERDSGPTTAPCSGTPGTRTVTSDRLRRFNLTGGTQLADDLATAGAATINLALPA